MNSSNFGRLHVDVGLVIGVHQLHHQEIGQEQGHGEAKGAPGNREAVRRLGPAG